MDPIIWSRWTDTLRQFHITSPILTLLEGGGPLKVILAQGMLALSPFVGSSAETSWKTFAEMLEDPDTSRTFADHLRQEKP